MLSGELPGPRRPSRIGVRDGGRWRVFSSGSAGLLGADSAGRTRHFTSGEVHATPLVRDGRTIGLSFRPNRAVDIPVAHHDSFLVDAATVDGRFRLRLADGRTLLVEAPALANVVARSEAFLAAGAAGPVGSITLLAKPSSPAGLGRAPRPVEDFQQELTHVFGFDRPVHVSGQGAWRQSTTEPQPGRVVLAGASSHSRGLDHPRPSVGRSTSSGDPILRLAPTAATLAAPVETAAGLLHGTEPSGRPRAFRADEVVVAPLAKRGRIVGATFSPQA
ncbi:hypothetical protein, partial [Kutzneria sp. 744]|uniref:hypothetical protein n=1 Tax=Kutzneria sp. (strain 744) TaxID=345341 RepID=UPI001E4A2060